MMPATNTSPMDDRARERLIDHRQRPNFFIEAGLTDCASHRIVWVV